MKRRNFLKVATTSTVAAVAASTLPSPAISQGRRQWRLITTWPKNLPGLGTVAQWFADKVTAATDGRLSVTLFASGEVVPAFESIDAVGTGTVEMGHGAPYYWKGKVKASQFVANIPFGLTAQEYNAWYHYGGGAEIGDEVYAELGCKFLVCGNTGVQMGGWFNKTMDSMESYKGLKMRIPGIGGEVVTRAGGTVINLPGSEVLAALASGSVDALEWNNPYGEAAMGFYRYAKYYYHPGWHESGTVLDLFINKKEWDKLPNDLKTIVEQCSFAANERMLSEFVARNGPALEVLKTKHGVEARQFPDDVLQGLGRISGEVIGELAAADPLTGKVFASMNKFRGLQISWSNLTEASFLHARSLVEKWPA
jgi:TRAP-type mannitol/chloroaromatic compound transport system substrate-binding protein